MSRLPGRCAKVCGGGQIIGDMCQESIRRHDFGDAWPPRISERLEHICGAALEQPARR
jgi:hypothetical protein